MVLAMNLVIISHAMTANFSMYRCQFHPHLLAVNTLSSQWQNL